MQKKFKFDKTTNLQEIKKILDDSYKKVNCFILMNCDKKDLYIFDLEGNLIG